MAGTNDVARIAGFTQKASEITNAIRLLEKGMVVRDLVKKDIKPTIPMVAEDQPATTPGPKVRPEDWKIPSGGIWC